MPKDSQPDNKQARSNKSDSKTPITQENKNQNQTGKKKKKNT